MRGLPVQYRRHRGSTEDEHGPRGTKTRYGPGVPQSERTGAMTVTDELLANNERYAESFPGQLPLPPSKQLAVVACMDARLNVYDILGLHDGAADVIRNAGGGVTRS